MTEVLHRLSTSDLSALAAALRSGRLAPPFSEVAVRRFCGSSVAADVAAGLEQLIGEGMQPRHVATLIEAVGKARSHHPNESDLVELVWSGPEGHGVTNRDTGVVVRELFGSATTEVLVAGFAVCQGRDVFRRLAERMVEVPGLRVRAEAGELAFGTVDSFLVWRLTGGRAHITDVSNASRTLLMDLATLAWDPKLCAIVGVPMAMLPEIRSSSEVLTETDPALFGAAIPIAGIAGDQQAATFGQACHTPGTAKNTYGTGAFMLLNTGGRPMVSGQGLLSTVLWRLGADQPAAYALEGSVFIAGAAVQWLRDGLRAISHAGDVEAIAAGAQREDGVYLVPAFVGLGAPHWDPDARGLLIGLTRGTGLAEVARATVDSMAYQVRDVLDAMEADARAPLDRLRVDGGAAVNDELLQFQADLLGVPVERPMVTETTALGAAFLAGLAVGFWSGTDEIAATWVLDRRFEPQMPAADRGRLLRGWRAAVGRSLGWAGVLRDG